MLLDDLPMAIDALEHCGPRATDCVRLVVRCDVRNRPVSGHDSGIRSEPVHVDRIPLPLWVLHVVTDVVPECSNAFAYGVW